MHATNRTRARKRRAAAQRREIRACPNLWRWRKLVAEALDLISASPWGQHHLLKDFAWHEVIPALREWAAGRPLSERPEEIAAQTASRTALAANLAFNDAIWRPHGPHRKNGASEYISEVVVALECAWGLANEKRRSSWGAAWAEQKLANAVAPLRRYARATTGTGRWRATRRTGGCCARRCASPAT